MSGRQQLRSWKPGTPLEIKTSQFQEVSGVLDGVAQVIQGEEIITSHEARHNAVFEADYLTALIGFFRPV